MTGHGMDSTDKPANDRFSEALNIFVIPDLIRDPGDRRAQSGPDFVRMTMGLNTETPAKRSAELGSRAE
jgi:hypothetical protein